METTLTGLAEPSARGDGRRQTGDEEVGESHIGFYSAN